LDDDYPVYQITSADKNEYKLYTLTFLLALLIIIQMVKKCQLNWLQGIECEKNRKEYPQKHRLRLTGSATAEVYCAVTMSSAWTIRCCLDEFSQGFIYRAIEHWHARLASLINNVATITVEYTEHN